ncbi:MAG: YjfB family protein [Myxococcota bacterium]|nr:YjfB family protein [Myxococcota bacterium]
MSEVRLSTDSLRLSMEVATLKKGLDNMKMEGQAAVELISSASPPVRVASPPHLGTMVDFYA